MSQVRAVLLDSVIVESKRRRAKRQAEAPAAAAPVSTNAQVAGLQRLTRAMGVNAQIKDQWIGLLSAQVRAGGKVPAPQSAPWMKPQPGQGTTAIAKQIDGLTKLRTAMAHNAQIKDRRIAALAAQVKSLGKVPASPPRPFVKP